jgi:uncharacterized protein YjiS (DUF1127 family)
MILRLECADMLRVRGARGMAIDIVDGHVWITEAGRAGDSFLEPGRSYRVGGDGVVLIAEEAALAPGASCIELGVRRSLGVRLRERLSGLLAAYAGWRASSRTRRELRQLPDRMLRDIGLRRDQLF